MSVEFSVTCLIGFEIDSHQLYRISSRHKQKSCQHQHRAGDKYCGECGKEIMVSLTPAVQRFSKALLSAMDTSNDLEEALTEDEDEVVCSGSSYALGMIGETGIFLYGVGNHPSQHFVIGAYVGSVNPHAGDNNYYPLPVLNEASLSHFLAMKGLAFKSDTFGVHMMTHIF